MWFNRRRMEMELLMLEVINRLTERDDGNGDIILQEIWRLLMEILIEVCLWILISESDAYDSTDIFGRIMM
ncbi:hypothetical protein DPMN_092769 [Dreissena polymorpha]|uniref:Uncharacterized protein n=1 Tax=Dreissena polymorpha TaxID=45954 RepID=A0A9D4L250_DREPO|nr:hypothetical protein DPMN_092769 [Dreissena polymorpha]